ncbi:GNAT family N-acetyltransferase [Microvirga guangxiensis]|uniref:Acetyltransferase involved in cellulose biosynthesis, CelD/BcsL family n=1 Tax=Microvirga guangxiensis TaxID=549386 RepID=A0A1G5H0N2_9HYPH|nr:GNAT family N-acetyltransferase [Microvirga guangxiensis]SCY57109.1 Acetyltransferase involved in cellulose biosynthesis, CelD/BcsL family [Microvirga guangxiensis]
MTPLFQDQIKVEALTNLEAFDRYATEWDAAVQQASFIGVQMRHFWIRRWLTTIGAGQDIAFQILRDGAGVVGCAAWVPTVQRMGLVSAPVLRLAGQPLFKRSQIVLVRRQAQAVSAMLADLRKMRWRWLDPGLLTDDDPLLSNLPAFSNGIKPCERNSYTLPLISADGNWDAYLSSRSRTIRKQYRRRLSTDGLKIRVFPSDFTSLDELIGVVEQVARRSWSFDEGTSVVSTASHWEFWRGIIQDAVAQNLLHASCLFQGERPTAFIFGIHHNKVLYALKSSFDPELSKIAPGQAVICSLIQTAMENREIETIDLDCIIGRGDYKLDWATETRTMRQYYAFRSGFLPKIFLHAYQIKKHLDSRTRLVSADLTEAAS